MKTVFMMAIIVSAATLASSQTHTRYLPVSASTGASNRRYLPTGRGSGNGRPAIRSQPQGRQAEPTGQYLPPDEDEESPAPANRVVDDELSGPYPPSQTQQGYQSEGPRRPQNPTSEVGSSRRYLPTAAGGTPSTSRGQSRGQKTYLPPEGYYQSESGGSGLASYDFEYQVEDAKSGNSFGHRESRRGDTVTGGYRVLLPDGRTQIVDYVADQGGYKPKLSYEGTVNSVGGGTEGYRYKRFHRY